MFTLYSLHDDSWEAGTVVTCLEITSVIRADEMSAVTIIQDLCYLIKAWPAAGANPIPPALLPVSHLPPSEWWQHACKYHK